jgi:hypothetical protein
VPTDATAAPNYQPNYQQYLAAARELAASLVMQPSRQVPADVNASLVFFKH